MRASTRRDGAHTINSKPKKSAPRSRGMRSLHRRCLRRSISPFVSIARAPEARVIAVANGRLRFIARASIVTKSFSQRTLHCGGNCELPRHMRIKQEASRLGLQLYNDRISIRISLKKERKKRFELSRINTKVIYEKLKEKRINIFNSWLNGHLYFTNNIDIFRMSRFISPVKKLSKRLSRIVSNVITCAG